MSKKKVMIIGLDCADPTLTFDKWLNDLPNIKRVVNSGIYGPMKSSIPPITVPAWASMVTGRDPGELGFYGFRNRRDYTYSNMDTIDSLSLSDSTIWDVAGKYGKESIIIGVPPSYPPKPIKGNLISCFLTPCMDKPYTYPFSLKVEIENLVGNYLVDVKNFRTNHKEKLLEDIYEMTEKRFKVANHFIRTKPWDLFMMVEMGIDRIQHAFWKYMDEKHPLYEKDSKFKNAIFEYYKYVDDKIGELLRVVDEETTTIIVSDHGAKRMDGGVCINEWLIEKGYLTLKKYPDKISRLNELDVDWDRTIAWGEGGYYGRVFLNVNGREPRGRIEYDEYEKTLKQLQEELLSIKDQNGNPIDTKVYSPKEVYNKIENIPPDLLVFFGDLNWRSIGTVGHNKIHTIENDSGPDGANHDWEGIFTMAKGKDLLSNKSLRENISINITDIAPMILEHLDITPQNK